MCRKILFLMSLVVVFGLVSNAYAEMIDYTNVTASSYNYDPSWGTCDKTTDNSGMQTGGTYGLHDEARADMWMGREWDWNASYSPGNTIESSTWIAFSFDRMYNLQTTWIWNGLDATGTDLTLGTRKAQFALYDGSSWSTLDFTIAKSGGDDDPGAAGPDLTGYSASLVVITRYEGKSVGNWGEASGTHGRAGLAEVRFFIPEPATIALLGIGGLALLRRKR
jgi:hypothetical protein